jgi:hypothetical protein
MINSLIVITRMVNGFPSGTYYVQQDLDNDLQGKKDMI